MNFIYSYPLFEKDDSRRAFNYLYLDENTNNSYEGFEVLYTVIKNDDIRLSNMIMLANAKYVQKILFRDLLPKLNKVLEYSGEKHDIIIFDPSPILSMYNPFKNNKLIDKFNIFILTEFYNIYGVWICFNEFSNKALEQFIKLKYSKYISESGNKLYLKIGPFEDFSLIYSLIDDIFQIY